MVRRNKRLRWPRRVLVGLGAAWLVAACAWLVAVYAWSFPDELISKDVATSEQILDGNGISLRQEANAAGVRERWVPLEAISQHLIDATLASEDNDFYDHGGVDWTAMARAALLDLRHRQVEFGGSTITMQLVRLVAGTGRRSLGGKLHQMVLAGRLERKLGKREILEQYLNRVYYGNGAWGIEQAAHVYFDKRAAELSVGEAALLAVIPRGPTFYDPMRQRERAMTRRSHILELMADHGYLTAEERALAERTPLQIAHVAPSFRAPHFVEEVKLRLPAAFQHGATVRTTLDWDLQHRLEVALDHHVKHLAPRNVNEAAVVVLRNSDGAILALVGSKDYAEHPFNGVTARLRPGSTLKPFVYGAAFEAGDTPATVADDVVVAEDAHQAYTKDVKSHGFARYRESLAGSYNLSAVHTLQRVGVTTVLRKLRAAGITTLDKPDAEYDWGLAVGEAEVRLLDLTAAFTGFARGGVPITPRAIDRARSADGETWSEPVVPRERVFSEEIAYLLYDILSDPDARKPMFGDRVPLDLPFKIALKTGTTKAYTDLWAIGVTREFTVGVWAGNFDGSPTYRVMSTEGATPLVRAAYTAIAARYGNPTAPPRPEGVVEADICPLSGKLPGPYCEHRKREVFVAGHVPEETCDWHQLVCGVPTVVYPDAVRAWAKFYGKHMAPECGDTASGAGSGRIAIANPINGAHFVLEPHRSPETQRPPLVALPQVAGLVWTIDGQPADSWIPTPGAHHVVVTRGAATSAVDITYE